MVDRLREFHRHRAVLSVEIRQDALDDVLALVSDLSRGKGARDTLRLSFHLRHSRHSYANHPELKFRQQDGEDTFDENKDLGTNGRHDFGDRFRRLANRRLLGRRQRGGWQARAQCRLDSGVTFIDTADVYGDGRSEKIIAAVLRERGGEKPFVAHEGGRRLNPHVVEGYTAAISRPSSTAASQISASKRLISSSSTAHRRRSTIAEVFGALDGLVTKGKIRHYGVSVEKVEEALKAIEYPGVATVQIIYNIFRQRRRTYSSPRRKKGMSASSCVCRWRPACFRARSAKIRILLQTTTATSIVTAKPSTSGDLCRRALRRALQAVDELRKLVPANVPMVQFALRWILAQDAVSVVIPEPAMPRRRNRTPPQRPCADRRRDARAIAALYERLVKGSCSSALVMDER